MSEITVRVQESPTVTVSKAQAMDCASVLTGIAYMIWWEGWKEGCRNNAAVDWCIACEVFGIQPQDEIEKYINKDFTNMVAEWHDRSDAEDRIETILGYVDGYTQDVYYFMMMRDHWIELARKAEKDPRYNGPIYRVDLNEEA